MDLRTFDDAEYLGPANPAEFEALEAHLGIKFPDAFRQFILATGGAAFMEETHQFKARFPLGETTPTLQWIYSIEQIRSLNDIWHGPSTYDEEDPAIDPKTIVIGSAVDDTDQGPVLLDLRPDAPQFGAVYFRHLTFSAKLAGVSWFEALAYVAPSFEAFLNSLGQYNE